jgi:pSer/pThr/pTyr-binding forkhead associated (FHA) protein
MFQLRIVAGTDQGKEFALKKSTCVMGRKRACNVVLSSPAVSREHARIQRRHGHYYLVAFTRQTGRL